MGADMVVGADGINLAMREGSVGHLDRAAYASEGISD